METIHIEEFYKRYAPMVLRRCRLLLKDEEQARDAMQEVFVRMLSRRDQLDCEFPSSLLFRIATNHCLNVLRNDKKRRNLAENALLTGIVQYDENEERTVISDLLDRLFHRQKASTREIAVMYFLYGLSLQEVSREVGLSVSGVRKRILTLKKSAKDFEFKEVPYARSIDQ